MDAMKIRWFSHLLGCMRAKGSGCRKFSGFTLIEISMTVFIASLLLHGIFNLLFVTMNRFTKQEESLMCIFDASLISARLRQDFEACITSSPATAPFSMAQDAVSFNDTTLAFSVSKGNGAVLARYIFDPASRSLSRETEGQVTKIGEGHVTMFSAVNQILCKDGVIHSFPADPHSGVRTPAVSSATIPLRCWVKVSLTVEGKTQTKPEVKQTYEFRIFPVRLNRTIQSIWNNL